MLPFYYFISSVLFLLLLNFSFPVWMAMSLSSHTEHIPNVPTGALHTHFQGSLPWGSQRPLWYLSGKDILPSQVFTRQCRHPRCSSQPPVRHMLKKERFASRWQLTQLTRHSAHCEHRGMKPRGGEDAVTQWGEAGTTRIVQCGVGFVLIAAGRRAS